MSYEEILDDLITVNDEVLSRIDLLLVDKVEDDSDWDVLWTLKEQQAHHILWLKGLKHGISEGFI